MTAARRPRILIISPSVFNQYTGTGVFLTNLFRGWPRESIAILHGDSTPPDDRVCGKFFAVGPDELRWAGPMGWFQRRVAPEANSASSKGYVAGRESGLKTFLRRCLGDEWPWTARLSLRLRVWIDAFRPELIYVTAGGPYMRMAILVADALRIPIVTHMMDDWPAVIGRRGLLGPYLRHRALKDLQELFRRSTLRLAISDSMASVYRERYGVPFSVFSNAVDVAAHVLSGKRDWAAQSPFTIVYIGTIFSNNQQQSLLDVAAMVGQLNAGGRAVEMRVYSAWSAGVRPELEQHKGVFAEGALDDATVFERLVKADLLLIPINFDEESVRYVRLSMPAKVPLYMATGTPILVYGPRGMAAVDYAVEEGWAEVVTERKPDLLRAAVVRLMDDATLRWERGVRAQTVVKLRHDAPDVRDAFQLALSKVLR